MKFTMRSAFVAMVAVALFAGVRAQDDPVEVEVEQPRAPRHPLTDMPEEAEDVQTYFTFPNRQLGVTGAYPMAAGEKVEVAVGFHNDGETPINVSGIMASLNAPQDFSMHIQNFTFLQVGQAVPPGGELSVSYVFQPDPALSPREFQVAITAFYEADGELFSSTFFNSTVDIVDASGNLDLQTLFMYFFILAIVGALASIGYGKVASITGMKRSKPAKRPAPVAEDVSGDNEWLKGTNVEFQAARKMRNRSAASKGKK